MPKLTEQQEASKRADEKVLKKLSRAAGTQRELGCTRYRLLKLQQEKLIKAAGEVKNVVRGRKAISYELTARGRKRAEKLA